jgi:hypothetical protein
MSCSGAEDQESFWAFQKGEECLVVKGPELGISMDDKKVRSRI